MTGEDAAAFLHPDEPAHREPASGSPRRRSDRALTRHVPVRFSAEAVEAVGRFAQTDDMTVSAWIRRAVNSAIREWERP